jgi:hypothetical protein
MVKNLENLAARVQTLKKAIRKEKKAQRKRERMIQKVNTFFPGIFM